ncbi:MAG TPA: O-antigen ligase family protein [Candidatus Limnocylindrales bacterium]|nr:O-antigen ligase family protein [Candidatus Limnocylindrales bacterium]
MERQRFGFEPVYVSRCPGVLLLVALILVVLEGAVRKWLIGSESGFWSYLAYFSKDLAFVGILLWPGQPTRSSALSTFSKFMVLGGGLFVTGAILSSLRGLNPVGALLTFRAGLLLPVVSLLAARRLIGIRFKHAAFLLAALTLLNCLLGCVQTRLPPEHVLNRYVVNDSAVTAIESAVRATGTYSYITGMGIMSSVGIWAGMVLLASGRTRMVQLIAVTGIIAGFGCGLTSVSRGPVVVGFLMLFVWIFASCAGFRAFMASKMAWAFAVLVICGAGFLPQFSRMSRSVIQRHEESNETFGQRAFGQLEEAWEAAVLTPFGAGPGTEQIGGNYAATGTMSFTNYETQFPRIIAEAGVLGLAGFLVICIGVIASLQTARRTAPTEGLNAALFATQLLLIPLFYGNVLFNHIASAVVWIIFAAMMANCAESETPTENQREIRSDSVYRHARPRP